MSWTGCEQQRVASPRGVACIIVRIAIAKVKKVVEKIKEERAEREERILFFLFFFQRRVGETFRLHDDVSFFFEGTERRRQRRFSSRATT